MASATTRLLLVVALCLVGVALFPAVSHTDESADDTAVNVDEPESVDADLSAHKSTGTDADVVEREEQAIKLDGMSVAEAKLLRDKADRFEFQAEVNRMMKLIINSLYKNKEIFLRELISNASDALDKIRFLSLTDKSALGDVPDLHIKIHADKDNGVLHITDTGIGMTRDDLVNNLGTIAKSGTSEFLTAVSEGQTDASSLIGQFGVGFYSAFLVADTVVVTTKHNDDKQYIWTSDADSFTIVEDPREEEQLGRGTRVSLYLKEEAREFLQENRLRELVRKYSEFINFDIYLYTSKEVEIDVEAEEEALREEEESLGEDADKGDEEADDEDDEEDEEGDEDEDELEDEDEEEEEVEAEPTKTTKTVWDWEVINANKPIWTRNPKEVEEEEYNSFYKAFAKDTKDPLAHIHFTAEGEVTFRSILYIPKEAPAGFFSDYGNSKNENLKLYVRRVFITDEFEDMLPKYLGFIRGVVDSDDLPLNVSRETLQQHKLLRVIKKKIVRKALEMIKKMDDDTFKQFWKEFGTSIKLGLIEDFQNKSRLAKLVRFYSSHDDGELTSLDNYVARMKKSQEHIFFVAGTSVDEVKASPFVERLLKRGYEVLYLTEPVDEYTIQNLPEYDGKKFQNAAKEGLKLDDSEEAQKYKEEQEEEFKPLTDWLSGHLKKDIEKAVVSDRLTDSPCALVASQYGWSGNMERIMKAQAYSRDDPTSNFYARQKKTLEINPRHPLIKNLLERTKALGEEGEDEEETAEDATLEDTARVLLDTARLRSGYMLSDSVSFAQRIERMLRVSAGVDLDAAVEDEPVFEDEEDEDEDDEDEDEEDEEEEEIDDEDEEEEEQGGEESDDKGVAHEEL